MTAEVLPGLVTLPAADIDSRPWTTFGGMSHVHVKDLYESPGAVAGLMCLDPGAHEVRHVHVGGQHHVWVVSGSVVFDGTPLGTGSYVHVPEGMTHNMRDAGPDGCTLFFVFARQVEGGL